MLHLEHSSYGSVKYCTHEYFRPQHDGPALDKPPTPCSLFEPQLPLLVRTDVEPVSTITKAGGRASQRRGCCPARSRGGRGIVLDRDVAGLG